MASLDTKVKRFLTSYKKKGSMCLEILLECMDNYLAHNNWDPLANMLTGLEQPMQRKARKIVGLCIGGIKLVKSKKHYTGVEFKATENFGATDRMPELRALVKQEQSILSKNVAEFINGEKEEKAFDANAFVARVDKYIKKALEEGAENGVGVETMRQHFSKSLIEALKNQMAEKAQIVDEEKKVA